MSGSTNSPFGTHRLSTYRMWRSQFEFPTEDVEAWAERPALSKTAPIPADAVITEPWKKGYRWRIPHLPSTDSIEFTFRAVTLTVISSFKLYGSSGWPWQEQGPWELSHRVLNTGTETCIVQSDQLTGAPV